MKKYNLILVTCFLFLGMTTFSYSQNTSISSKANAQDIIGLTLHPNPVNQGKLYITTKHNLAKDVEIFNVLGKRIISTTLFGKELNVSKLKRGVYILKITENKIRATRKLIIK